MHIHYLQHVPFEDLGALSKVFHALGHTLSSTHLYAGETLPELATFDALVIMGGPMGVADDQLYPWLPTEKAFIRRVLLETQKPVLGICLGAQLIADSLGAAVTRNRHREIGWFPITLDQQWLDSPWSQTTGSEPLLAFHWHGDTFALPDGALPLGKTEACANQGFIVDDRIIGLQFHLETIPTLARALVTHCKDELDGSTYVQGAERILGNLDHFDAINKTLPSLVECWLHQPRG